MEIVLLILGYVLKIALFLWENIESIIAVVGILFAIWRISLPALTNTLQRIGETKAAVQEQRGKLEGLTGAAKKAVATSEGLKAAGALKLLVPGAKAAIEEGIEAAVGKMPPTRLQKMKLPWE